MTTRFNRPFAFDEVPESNFTSYPEPFRNDNSHRYNRRLGNFAGLTNFGVNLTRIVPGGQSSARHAHSTQDEFVHVLAGTPTLETNEGEFALSPGMNVGFPAGTGVAHRFVNKSLTDVLLLVVGDHTRGDTITYSDLDLQAQLGDDLSYQFFHKSGKRY
jgi:uncharacterized cupin superfamily protein